MAETFQPVEFEYKQNLESKPKKREISISDQEADDIADKVFMNRISKRFLGFDGWEEQFNGNDFSSYWDSPESFSDAKVCELLTLFKQKLSQESFREVILD